MLYKHGADFAGLQAPMWYALGVMEVIYAKKGEHMVLSVGTNGVHSVPNSLHAKGLAVDLRTRNLSDTIVALMVADAKLILFPMGYDVVNEHHTVIDGIEQPHIHVEYDPKEGRDSYNKEVIEA